MPGCSSPSCARRGSPSSGSATALVTRLPAAPVWVACVWVARRGPARRGCRSAASRGATWPSPSPTARSATGPVRRHPVRHASPSPSSGAALRRRVLALRAGRRRAAVAWARDRSRQLVPAAAGPARPDRGRRHRRGAVRGRSRWSRAARRRSAWARWTCVGPCSTTTCAQTLDLAAADRRGRRRRSRTSCCGRRTPRTSTPSPTRRPPMPSPPRPRPSASPILVGAVIAVPGQPARRVERRDRVGPGSRARRRCTSRPIRCRSASTCPSATSARRAHRPIRPRAARLPRRRRAGQPRHRGRGRRQRHLLRDRLRRRRRRGRRRGRTRSSPSRPTTPPTAARRSPRSSSPSSGCAPSEFGRTVLVAATSGISAVIAPDRTVEQQLDEGEAGWLVAEAPSAAS